MLAAVMLGERLGQQVEKKAIRASYADAIGAVRSIVSLLGLELKIEQVVEKGFHPGRTAKFIIGDSVIGYAGEIHPEVTASYDLPRQVSFFEINLDELVSLVPEVVSAKSLHTFPAATQDLSLVVDKSIPAVEVLDLIQTAAGELLEEVVLVDDFRGGNLKETEKSLTFSLRFRASDRTLTQAEATEAKDNAVQAANKKFGAVIRS